VVIAGRGLTSRGLCGGYKRNTKPSLQEFDFLRKGKAKLRSEEIVETN